MAGRPKKAVSEDVSKLGATGMAQTVTGGESVTTTTGIDKIDIKVTPGPEVDISKTLHNLDARVQELENYRNPSNVDKVIRQNQDSIEDHQARLNRIEALLKKAYALDTIPDEIQRKSIPGNVADAKNVPQPNM